MKKIILSLLAGMFLFTSCDLLNNDPYTEFTKSNYFTSETNVKMFANYFYNAFAGYGSGNGDFYFKTLNDNQGVTGLSKWSYTSVSATNSTWNSCYEEIRRANTLLENVDKAGMTEAKTNNWIGIARLYRAYQHYLLVRSFGDCYWVDKVLKTGDKDVLYGPRQDRDAVMDKVLADLEFAVANITDNASARTEFNVHVANAIMSEICLYEGTFCKYRTAADNGKAADATRANKFLNASKEASKRIMDAGMFSLTQGVAGYRANYNSVDLKGNTEMILYKQYIYGTMAHGTIDYCCGSTQTNGMSKAAFDSYLFTDGHCLANTTLDKNDHATVETVNWQYGDSIYTHQEAMMTAPLAVRDPRLSQHIDAELRYVGHGVVRYWDHKAGFGAAENTSSTGYGVLKFDTKEGDHAKPADRQATNGNDTDAPIFWYAVTLLNHAEACAELGESAAAIVDLNALRARVGMPAFIDEADPANNMGVSNLIWEVRRERRVEMMYDMNDRYWSLIRWHQLDKLDTQNYPDQVKGAWIGDDFPTTGSLPTRFADGYLDIRNGNERVYEARQYLNPIPSGQATLNPEIGQNPGW